MKTMNIINEYSSLKKGLKHIILNNTANLAPYHNINHLLTVTKHSYSAIHHLNINDKVEELLLAALFHDFNHSMGKETDANNVIEAKLRLKEFTEIENINLDLDFMNMIIDSTQYPYVIDSKDLNIHQKIIRDADLCQIFEYDWLKQTIFGLSSELNIPVVSFIKGQRTFLESIEFLTSYGSMLYDENFNNLMIEIGILEDIFD